ncbi:hypothetical protein [Micromonospora saelicesensis]|uniref:hypothetical protein n=1 Tax=Micromonospora saelicesensis TaxID=285676 RepID=UPI000DC2B5DE|nr:hypothetical protein [Micromonospora saelicesensis]RAO63168.1 hypothetical protein PSN01_00587 [Micromonospora saelicesensis]
MLHHASPFPFAPDQGESALDLSNKFPGSTLGATRAPVPLGDGTADLSTRQDLFRQQFAADVSEQQASSMAVTQRPIRDAALSTGSGKPAWSEIPPWFALSGTDRNIPVKAQRWMAEPGDRPSARITEATQQAGPGPPP